uniref:ANK_REP_REGION domain-containing protein n=1 Tax=Macrostomum lignano TaxID=282301 RepID=A0A1I8I4L5_9PLAT
YIGCYRDPGPRDLNGLAGKGSVEGYSIGTGGVLSAPGINSLEFCSRICSLFNFKYFGVQYSSQCFCGNEFGRHGASPETGCSMRCTGNPDQICGDSEMIQLAVKSGQLEAVKFAVRIFADETNKDQCCMEAAKTAAIKDEWRVLKFLVQSIADETNRDQCCMEVAESAASSGVLEVVKFLVQTVADETKRDQCCMEAAESAASKDQWEVVTFLVQRVTDETKRDQCCIQAAESAASKGQWEVVAFLIQRVTDETKRDQCCMEPATYAASKGQWEVPAHITQLLRLSISQRHVALAVTLINDERVSAEHVDLPDSTGATALMLAADAGHHELTEKLIDLGASVRAEDSQGRTALSRACEAGHVRAAKALMDRGADASHRDGRGLTCAQVAQRFEQRQVLRLLDAGGARRLSNQLHRLLRKAGFTEQRAECQQRLADWLQKVARVLTQDGYRRNMTGSYAEGWANSLVQVNGRTAADSDIDWTVLAVEQELHLEGGCDGCRDATPLQVEEGHAQVAAGAGSQPAVAATACGFRPAQDTCHAIDCCSSFCEDRIEKLLNTRHSYTIVHLVRATRPSSTNELRVSFSFQEKDIMRQLSTVQGQLFTLIKFIFKRHLPLTLDTPGLKTYHAKTLLFFMLEKQSKRSWVKARWQPHNLIALLNESLDMMLSFIDSSSSPDECMPHFFMPDAPLYFKNAGIGGDFDNTKARVRDRLRELRSDIGGVVDQLRTHVRPLQSEKFYFHPFTLLPLTAPPAVTEIREESDRYSEKMYYKFADVYSVVHQCVSELQSESSNRSTLMSQLSLLHELQWCKCAALCMTSHGTFETLFTARLSQPLSSHLYVNFRCLSWSLQAELLRNRAPAIAFDHWIEQLLGDPDLEELLTLAHYSDCREHVELSLQQMEMIEKERRVAMETQDEKKIGWLKAGCSLEDTAEGDRQSINWNSGITDSSGIDGIVGRLQRVALLRLLFVDKLRILLLVCRIRQSIIGTPENSFERTKNERQLRRDVKVFELTHRLFSRSSAVSGSGMPRVSGRAQARPAMTKQEAEKTRKATAGPNSLPIKTSCGRKQSPESGKQRTYREHSASNTGGRQLRSPHMMQNLMTRFGDFASSIIDFVTDCVPPVSLRPASRISFSSCCGFFAPFIRSIRRTTAAASESLPRLSSQRGVSVGGDGTNVVPGLGSNQLEQHDVADCVGWQDSGTNQQEGDRRVDRRDSEAGRDVGERQQPDRQQEALTPAKPAALYEIKMPHRRPPKVQVDRMVVSFCREQTSLYCGVQIAGSDGSVESVVAGVEFAAVVNGRNEVGDGGCVLGAGGENRIFWQRQHKQQNGSSKNDKRRMISQINLCNKNAAGIKAIGCQNRAGRIPPVVSSDNQGQDHHLLAISEDQDSIIPGLQLRSTKPIRSLWITWSPTVEFLIGSDLMNRLPHTGHTKRFSPVCVLTCLCSSSDRVKRRPQCARLQTKGRSPCASGDAPSAGDVAVVQAGAAAAAAASEPSRTESPPFAVVNCNGSRLAALCVSLGVLGQVVGPHESLAAHGAHEAFLTGVRPHVPLQLVRPGEATAAVRQQAADERPFARVPAEMRLQVRGLVVHLAAAGDVAVVQAGAAAACAAASERAGESERQLPIRGSQLRGIPAIPVVNCNGSRLAALCVSLGVLGQVVGPHESLAAHGAHEAFLTGVRPHVPLQLVRPGEATAAVRQAADERPFARVPAEMRLQVRGLVVHLAAAGDVAVVQAGAAAAAAASEPQASLSGSCRSEALSFAADASAVKAERPSTISVASGTPRADCGRLIQQVRPGQPRIDSRAGRSAGLCSGRSRGGLPGSGLRPPAHEQLEPVVMHHRASSPAGGHRRRRALDWPFNTAGLLSITSCPTWIGVKCWRLSYCCFRDRCVDCRRCRTSCKPAGPPSSADDSGQRPFGSEVPACRIVVQQLQQVLAKLPRDDGLATLLEDAIFTKVQLLCPHQPCHVLAFVRGALVEPPLALGRQPALHGCRCPTRQGAAGSPLLGSVKLVPGECLLCLAQQGFDALALRLAQLRVDVKASFLFTRFTVCSVYFCSVEVADCLVLVEHHRTPTGRFPSTLETTRALFGSRPVLSIKSELGSNRPCSTDDGTLTGMMTRLRAGMDTVLATLAITAVGTTRQACEELLSGKIEILGRPAMLPGRNIETVWALLGRAGDGPRSPVLRSFPKPGSGRPRPGVLCLSSGCTQTAQLERLACLDTEQRNDRAERMGASNDSECPICMGLVQRAVVSRCCRHRFCTNCIAAVQQTAGQAGASGRCPYCRSERFAFDSVPRAAPPQLPPQQPIRRPPHTGVIHLAKKESTGAKQPSAWVHRYTEKRTLPGSLSTDSSSPHSVSTKIARPANPRLAENKKEPYCGGPLNGPPCDCCS